MPDNTSILPSGSIIGGTYKVLDFLGAGGMGHVYKVEKIGSDKILALKILKTEHVSETLWKRFRNEGQAISRLDHRNIIKLYDMDQAGEGVPFYTMDFLVGETLSERLRRIKRMPLEQAIPIFCQVSSGLAYAHGRGIIHRDVKPGNIMLVEEGQKTQAIIVDFGVAKLHDDDGKTVQRLTQPGEVFGSPSYMSPEQCCGIRLDGRSDMYSLGVSLFRALTGKLPFHGSTAIETTTMHRSTPPPTLAEMAPDLSFSPRLEKIMARMLAKSPDERYQSMAEVETQLRQLISNASAAKMPSLNASLNVTQGNTQGSTVNSTDGRDQSQEDSGFDLFEESSVVEDVQHRTRLMPIFAFAGIGLAIVLLFTVTHKLTTPIAKSPAIISSTDKQKSILREEGTLAAATNMDNYDDIVENSNLSPLDDTFKAVEDTPGVEELDATHLSSARLSKSSLLPKLRKLNIDAMVNVSPVIAHLGSDLEKLSVAHCQLKADDLQKLSHLPKLTELDLTACQVSDRDLALFRGSKITSLNLSLCSKLTSSCLETLKSLPLKDLHLPEQLDNNLNWSFLNLKRPR